MKSSVHVVVRVSQLGDTVHFQPLNISADTSESHWRDERAIAAALREMADRVEEGCSFELIRNLP